MVFSGIVEEKGEVVELRRSAELKLWDGSVGEGVALLVKCGVALDGASIGCSIAVNGTCLTAVTYQVDAPPGGGTFEVNLAPETLRRTNLGDLRAGDWVNLERSLKASDRNSGHNVQGHVDCTGNVFSKTRDGESLAVVIEVPSEIIKYIVHKGYIAIDGTSLTVCDVDRINNRFSIMLIAHTQSVITLPHKPIGARVNIEVDVLSKYVETVVGGRFEALEATMEARFAALGSTTGTSSSQLAAAPAAAAPPAAAPKSPPVSSAGATGENDEEIVQINKQTRTVHGAGLQVPLPTREALSSGCKVGIVSTCWHEELVNKMRSKCIGALIEGGVSKSNIFPVQVPGSWELPYAAARLADDVDVIVTIGILLKGGTIHMEVIANAMTTALMQVQDAKKTPIIFGVLTVLNMDQAVERAESDLGWSWGQSALSLYGLAEELTADGFKSLADLEGQ